MGFRVPALTKAALLTVKVFDMSSTATQLRGKGWGVTCLHTFIVLRNHKHLFWASFGSGLGLVPVKPWAINVVLPREKGGG